jgi:hypothetical protein
VEAPQFTAGDIVTIGEETFVVEKGGNLMEALFRKPNQQERKHHRLLERLNQQLDRRWLPVVYRNQMQVVKGDR